MPPADGDDMSVNSVYLLGRVTKPAIRFGEDRPGVRFEVETVSQWRTSDGRQHREPQYHNVSYYRADVDVEREAFYAIEGELRYHRNKDGTVRSFVKAGSVKKIEGGLDEVNKIRDGLRNAHRHEN